MTNIPIIMSLTSGAALLLGALLINHPQRINVNANRWLGFFTITLGLAMFEIFLVSQKFHLYHPFLFECIGITRFLTAPALYIAVVNFTSLDKRFQWIWLWHFVPFLLVVLFRGPFFITGFNSDFEEPTRQIILTVLQLILPTQAIVYWMLSFRKLKQHQSNINQFASATEKINLVWLQSFLIILLVILLVWLNLVFFDIQLLKDMTPILYLCSIFFLAYFSLKQREVFEFNMKDRDSLSEMIDVKKPVKQKRLDDKQLAILNEKLVHLMISEKLFLDNELSLPALSTKLGASANDTSYLINEVYAENFYNFINRHRIDEAKRLLLTDEYQKLNILGIAYQSGFNSKTAFHTAFKKHTQVSPTEFVKHRNT